MSGRRTHVSTSSAIVERIRCPDEARDEFARFDAGTSFGTWEDTVEWNERVVTFIRATHM